MDVVFSLIMYIIQIYFYNIIQYCYSPGMEFGGI